MIPRAVERRVPRGLAALVAISLATAACGEGPAAQDPAPTHSSGKTTTAASTTAGVFFPTQRPAKFGYEELQSGELIRDAKGCLRVRYQAGAVVPLWPPGYEPGAGGDEVRVLDAEGRIVGRVGEMVTMGGGGIREEALTEDVLDQDTKRELLERCPGTYFLVQEGTVRISQRG